MRNGRPTRRILGSVLREERELRRMSQEALGQAANIHRNYVGSAERGERNVSFEALERWLAALGLSWAAFGARLDDRAVSKL
jgi:transcriptional regulator with XRE-family HTH domain